jgi:hypothetical protein
VAQCCTAFCSAGSLSNPALVCTSCQMHTFQGGACGVSEALGGSPAARASPPLRACAISCAAGLEVLFRFFNWPVLSCGSAMAAPKAGFPPIAASLPKESKAVLTQAPQGMLLNSLPTH